VLRNVTVGFHHTLNFLQLSLNSCPPGAAPGGGAAAVGEQPGRARARPLPMAKQGMRRSFSNGMDAPTRRQQRCVRVEALATTRCERSVTMQISTVGIDLAKNVFQVHGANEHGRPVLRKQLRRDQVVPFFANLPPCLVGMEACGGAHHWARKLQTLGHTVKLMAPRRLVESVLTDFSSVFRPLPGRRRRPG
jgi:hypothetical protein